MAQWGLADFYGSSGSEADIPAYFDYARDALVRRCSEAWAPILSRHVLPFSYSRVQLPSNHSAMSWARKSIHCWEELLGVRAWCRLRAGLVRLSHRFHKRSAAKVQLCIFCDHSVTSAYGHVFGNCAEFADLRLAPLRAILSEAGADNVDKAVSILRVGPPDRAWKSVLRWCLEVDRRAEVFWQTCSD